MKISKKVITLLMACTFIGSGSFFSQKPVSAADSDNADYSSYDVYDNTLSSESKVFSEGSADKSVLSIGQGTKVTESISDVSLAQTEASAENPYKVFDIYNAHQRYVKLHSGDSSLMYKRADGIDVSYAQGKVDWKAVKDSGVDFAIIRAGYGNADKYPNQVDTWFKYNIDEAQKVGMDIGIYWYSYATDVEGAYNEAMSCYNVIKDYKLQYPVYFDIEEKSQRNLPTAEVSAIIETFCSTIEAKGFNAGLYSYASFLTTKVYEEVLDKYDIWVAHFDVPAPAYYKDYGIWQYNSKGHVNGISVEVDLNHCYVNYPYITSPDTYVPDGTESENGAPSYPIYVNKGSAKGIDVSVWQGKIDWEKVSRSDVDFAVIRAGYGDLASQKDKYFEANMEGAEKAGIDRGVYWYCYAITPEDAVLEAQACYEVIKDYKFNYPLYYVIEDTSLLSLSNEELKSIINAFCSFFSDKGYYIGIKSYASFLNTRVDADVFSKYDVWVAHYGVSRPAFKKSYNMWQYSCNERIDGINGSVNSNYAYLDFPSIMEKFSKNGY